MIARREGLDKMNQEKLVILETSDIHGHLYPINYTTNQPQPAGFAKIAGLVHKERAAHEHVILIDNGDLIQGAPFTYHYAKQQANLPNPMILAANHLQYDAAIFGNHEFNYGLNMLQQAVDESQFPWLSATIVNEATGEPYFGCPYLIKELPGGARVGILGMTTPYIPHWEDPKNIEGLVFVDAVETADKWVKHLKEVEKADIVIVSYHGGFERDLETGEPTEHLTGENQGYAICEKVAGIDVLLTGHQHRQIAGNTINGVLVMQPGNNGQMLGKVTLELAKENGKWVCQNKQSELIDAAEGETDQQMLALARPYEEAVQAWLDQPIGKIEGDMTVHDPLAIRMQDNPLIQFINRVQMETAGTDIANTALFHNEAPGFPENVTMRDVMANYIYPNTLKVIRITGKDMKEALEKSASYFAQYDGGPIQVSEAFTTPKPQHYNYDMWEGIEYEINISRPVGERVVTLLYQGQPVQMDAEYDVVMNNYRAGGGGDYFMYQDKPVIKDIPTDVSELLADYFLKHKQIKAVQNNHWRVTHD